MSLIKWEPFSDIDRLFDSRVMLPSKFTDWDFAVDVYEEDGNIVTKMNLPEVDSKDLDVVIEDNILTISGKREEEKETEKKDYYSKEIRRGSFSRSVRLPKSVQADKAGASYKDGVLVVTAPVVPGAKEKAVKVRLN